MTDDRPESDESEYLEGVEGEQIDRLIDTGANTLSLTPSQHERIKSLIHGSETFDEITNAETRYLVVGRDEGDLGDRRKMVQKLLGSRRSATAFRLEDFGLAGDDIDIWAPAFDLLTEMATYVVGVIEDYDGGHVWELGFLYHHESHVHDSLWILKRIYADEEIQRERYDNGMAASHLAVLEEAVEERVVRWQTEDELKHAVEEIP